MCCVQFLCVLLLSQKLALLVCVSLFSQLDVRPSTVVVLLLIQQHPGACWLVTTCLFCGIALTGFWLLYFGCVGDSRAVLSRGGKAIQVTDDHKPEREDEAVGVTYLSSNLIRTYHRAHSLYICKT